MERREQFQHILEEILGSRNVYFQPPESVKLQYPAIVYSREPITTLHADNIIYKKHYSYSVTLIDKKSDSVFIDKIMELPYCNHLRHYVSDNLNHDIFTIYY